MIKPIKNKKNISKKDSKPEKTADEIDWFVMDNWFDEYREPTEGMKIVDGRLLDVEGDCSM